jgi:hypothetical protein
MSGHHPLLPRRTPSISLAKALDVRSTSGFMSRLSAALVSSQSRRVSSWRTNFSEKSLRSCQVPGNFHGPSCGFVADAANRHA